MSFWTILIWALAVLWSIAAIVTFWTGVRDEHVITMASLHMIGAVLAIKIDSLKARA